MNESTFNRLGKLGREFYLRLKGESNTQLVRRPWCGSIKCGMNDFRMFELCSTCIAWNKRWAIDGDLNKWSNTPCENHPGIKKGICLCT